MSEIFKFSHRTDWELQPNQLISTLRSIQESCDSVIDLTESNSTRCGFKYPDEIISNLNQKQNLEYNPSPFGRLEARESICQYYKKKGYEVRPEQIFLTASTSEGYSFLFRLLANSEEHIMFPKPSYPLFQFLGDLNDVTLDFYNCTYKDHWAIDLKGLQDTIYPESKAIVLVNPNNPTGSYIKDQELKAINELCQRKQLAIICDEVFLDFPFNQIGQGLSLVANEKALTFVMGGLSKCLALPQMKVSWIVVNGPDDLVEEATGRLEVIADTYLSVNTPSQNALPAWLKCQDRVKEEILTRLCNNRQLAEEMFSQIPHCEVLAADGGWYMILKLPDVYSEEEWVLKLLREDHVFLHPGYFFDFSDEPYVVLSLLPDERKFKEGLNRIRNRIESLANFGVDQTR